MGPSRLTTPALAVLLAVTLTACTDATSSSQPTPTTSTSSTTATIGAPGPSPSSSASNSLDPDEARRALLQYRETVNKVFQSGGKLKPELANVAVAGQLVFLNQQADYLRQQGARQGGTVQLSEIRVLALVSDRGRAPSATLRACADSTRRAIIDRAGRALIPADKTAIFIQTFTLVKLPDKPWLVSSQDEKRVKTCH